MENQRHNPLRGIALMLGASLSFAVMAASAKFCSRNLPAIEVVFFRSLFGFLLTGLLVGWTKSPAIGKNQKILVGRGVVGFISLSLYFWALSQLDLGTAIMLNYTAPIFAVILAQSLLKEKLSSTTRLAVLLSFVGVYLLAAPEWRLKPLALLAGLLSGFFAGIVQILIRFSDEEESPLTIILYFGAISTAASLVLLWMRGFVPPSGWDWLGLAVVTLGSLFGQLGLTYSLRSAAVSVVSMFGYLTPVFGLFLGFILWGESLSAAELLGSVLVIACGAMMLKRYRLNP